MLQATIVCLIPFPVWEVLSSWPACSQVVPRGKGRRAGLLRSSGGVAEATEGDRLWEVGLETGRGRDVYPGRRQLRMGTEIQSLRNIPTLFDCLIFSLTIQRKDRALVTFIGVFIGINSIVKKFNKTLLFSTDVLIMQQWINSLEHLASLITLKCILTKLCRIFNQRFLVKKFHNMCYLINYLCFYKFTSFSYSTSVLAKLCLFLKYKVSAFTFIIHS